MTHPAEEARAHIMAGLEACQSNPVVSQQFETLAGSLAKAQGKLFPAAKLAVNDPAGVDMMRAAMEHLAQALQALQEISGGGDAIDVAAASIARSLKTLHPVVEAAKNAARSSAAPGGPVTGTGDTLNVNVNTVLNMNTDHQFYNGFSENIEEGGIFVATFDPKPIDSKVLVNFKLPGGRPVSARGVVHWVREYNPLNPETPPGMGVKFTDLLPGDKKAIDEFLARRAPMFYDD